VFPSDTGELAIVDGTVTLDLSDATSTSLWFSDRPMRSAGSIATTQLVANWASYGFDTDPPNAAIETGGRAVAFTISDITATDGAISATGPAIGPVAAAAEMPTTFTNAALFIDAAGATPPTSGTPKTCDDYPRHWPLDLTYEGEFLTTTDFNTWICALNELHGQVGGS